MNSVNLIGNLTRAPELRQAGETPVTTLRLAFSTRAKRDGEWVDESNYIDVTVWGRQAELAVEHLDKGRQVAVTGRLHWREWEAEDGTKRQAHEIVADTLTYLARPSSAHEADGGIASPETERDAEPVAAGDDIPY